MSAGGTTCPRCGGPSPLRLAPEQVCDVCQSAAAWNVHGDGTPIVISHDDIRRAAAAGRASLLRSPLEIAAAALPALIALALAVGAAWFLWNYFERQAPGPIAPMFERLNDDAGRAALLGAAAGLLAAIGLRRHRRGRRFRSAPLLVLNLVALLGSAAAFGVGGAVWAMTPSGTEWRYTEVPPLAEDTLTPQERHIQRATVAIVAPDEDGDARQCALGAGTVIARAPGEAWILTCSHVAMPYMAVGSWRDPRAAFPVYVLFSDGRGAVGEVRRTWRPPLDLALVVVEIDDPPAPVDVASGAEDLVFDSPVTFVPNPLRAGWLVHRGAVVKRRSHRTPAGEYSLVHTNLPVQPGDSGSGLYDHTGRIVGVNTWLRRGGAAAEAISLPAEAMRVILDSVRGRGSWNE